MKVVFLDVDGVLNCSSRMGQCVQVGREVGHRMDVDAVQRLATLCRRTGAKVVVSSTWRIQYGGPQVRRMLHVMSGYDFRVVGETPRLPRTDGRDPSRGEEIGAWLSRPLAPRVEAFVILDDGNDMGPYGPRLVQTTWELGLEDGHVDRAVALLMEDACMATKATEMNEPTSCLNKAADDEPIFVLRGQDACAIRTMEAWITEAERLGADAAKVRGVAEQAGAMLAWQVQHPERVKVPD